MRLELRVFETRVALRVLLLFLACAALPVATFAVLGYFQVRGQLASQSWTRLDGTSKTLGMSVIERLLLLDANLEAYALEAGGGAVPTLAAAASGRFAAVGTGTLGTELPFRLEPADVAHIRAGRPLIAIDDGPSPRVYLVREEGSGDRVVWGEIVPAYLDEVQLALPVGAELCVTAGRRPLIGCAEPSMLAAEPTPRQRSGSAEAVAWEDGETWLGARRDLFLAAEFGTGAWTVLVGEPRAQVFAPLSRFTRTFLLVLFLCLLIVAFASDTQLHRTLDPLARLIQGTERVAAGDLTARVELDTGDEFERLSESFNEMVLTLARQFRALTTAHEIDGAILGAKEIRTIAGTVLRQLPALVEADRAALVLFDTQPGREFEIDDRGALSQKKAHLSRDELLTRLAGGEAGPAGPWETYVPIGTSNGLHGAICLSGDPSALRDRAETHARQIADHVAVAISNAHLLRDLDDLNVGTLRALAGAIDAKSRWTAGHSSRVTTVALEIGRAMGLSSGELETLKRGSILHDVGKIAVPARILDKSGPLSDEEFRIMRGHTAHGVRIVEPITQYAPLLPIIGQHHERWDGTGYPDGLAGSAIDPLARIVAVADVYDAMTSERPYRGGLPPQYVASTIIAAGGSAFDPAVIDAFKRIRTARRSIEGRGEAVA